MTFLTIVLSVKITVTILVLCLPLLLLPKVKLESMFAFGDATAPFYRLYGVAMAALVAAYIGGLIAAMAGRFPTEIIVMGIVSNAGAALMMLLTGYARAKPSAFAFFGIIGLCLSIALLVPSFAMTRLT